MHAPKRALVEPPCSWPTPPATLVLGASEVHVWCVPLEPLVPQVHIHRRSLAADELTRADRLYFEKDRAHFAIARGVLRAILGRYLNRAPESLSFRYGVQGKPVLADASGGNRIRFNLSHSHGMALYAVTEGRELGIDIERIRPNVAILEIAERFFAAEEAAAIRALPSDLQREAFFRCWTRKEAYVKAQGKGLSGRLDEVVLPPPSDEPIAPPHAPAALCRTSPWSLRELTPAPGYVAALAVEARQWNLRCWRWPGADEPRAGP